MLKCRARTGFDFCSQCRESQEQEILGNQSQEICLKGAKGMYLTHDFSDTEKTGYWPSTKLGQGTRFDFLLQSGKTL